MAAWTSPAARADLLATINTCSDDGVDLIGTLGPSHPAQLSGGDVASVRVQTTNAYATDAQPRTRIDDRRVTGAKVASAGLAQKVQTGRTAFTHMMAYECCQHLNRAIEMAARDSRYSHIPM